MVDRVVDGVVKICHWEQGFHVGFLPVQSSSKRPRRYKESSVGV